MLSNYSGAAAQNILPYEVSAGILSFEEGQYYQAVQQLENAVSKYPMRIEPHVYLASAYLAIEDHTAAINAAEKGLVNFPGNIRLKLVIAEGFYRSGDDRAINEYLTILDMLENNQDLETEHGITQNQVRTTIGNVYQGMANEAYQDGRSQEALNLYYKAREYSPDNISIHNNLAYILFENGRLEESLEVLMQANERFPGAEQLSVLRGQIYNELNDSEKLLDVYSELYRDYPENLDYAIIYGQLLMSNNQAQKANLLFETLISENPGEKKLYDLLIRMNEQRYDYGGKRNVLKMQRRAFPDDRLVAEELAETHILIEEFEEARAIYDSLAVHDQSEKYHVMIARSWVFEEDFDAALQKYRFVIAEFGESQDLLIDTAQLHRILDQSSDAVDLLIKADSLGPKEELKVQIADLLVSQGVHSQARPYLNELFQSRYDSYATFYMNKISDKDLSRQELLETYRVILRDMITLYGDLFEENTDKVSQRVNNIGPVLPEIFQKDPVLEILENSLNDVFTSMSGHFNFIENIQIIEYALLTHPESAILHYQKGLMAFNDSKPMIALGSFKKAVEYGANDYNLYFQMGEIYHELGETKNAILSFEQTRTLNPQFAKAYSQLIDVSQKANQLDILCDRWLMEYKTDKTNDVFNEHLIEALHKADRFEEATQILRDDDSR
ncbi:tetratricopeptide repeat protein [Rhodohalobacter mucosus]|nr:tetratricopeptide repeat protein [Rhodohalobacter mucosus]